MQTSSVKEKNSLASNKVGEFECIGTSIPKIDANPKVLGSTKYIADMSLPGMLWAKILRGPYAHAKVVEIDTSEAEKLPGVKLILTPDVIIEMLGEMPCLGVTSPHNKAVLTDIVRYVGDEVAAVAAVDELTAEKALRLIKVKYEKLPFVLDPEEAMEPEAPKIHGGDSNIRSHTKVRAGDVDKAFKTADYVVKSKFQTSKPANACLETHGCISDYNPGKKELTHWSPNQSVFFTSIGLSSKLKLPISQIRAVAPEGIGGAFGSKTGCFVYDIIAALMSMKLGKPVKLILSREEEFSATITRHPYTKFLEMGFKNDGTIVAYKEKSIMDVGGYGWQSEEIAILGQGVTPGPYKIPNISIDTCMVYTNKNHSGAFRGFGDPQATFARESLLDMAAEKLGLDKVEIRLRNIINDEDLPYVTSTGMKVNSCGIKECIEKVVRSLDLNKKRDAFTGVGIACMSQWSSAKISFQADFASIRVEIKSDGSAFVYTGASDLGQGIYSTLAQIVVEELGVPIEKITVVGADSKNCPGSVGTFGSRGALMEGTATQKAAAKIRDRLFSIGGKKLNVPSEKLRLTQGKIIVSDDPDNFIAISEIAELAYFSDIDGDPAPLMAQATYTSQTVPFDENGHGHFSPAYAFAATGVEVEVDQELGKIKVNKIVSCHDVGRALNMDTVEGQLEGGIVQGIGYGLYEDVVYTTSGDVCNPNFADYKIPCAADIPEIEINIVETIDPETPLGMKGVGETGLNCVAPAIANAIFDATGIRFNHIPISPINVLSELGKKVVKRPGNSTT